MHLTNIEINNVEVEVHVDKSGLFRIHDVREEGTETPGTSLGYADSLDVAKNKARLAIKKRQVKVRVPFKTKGGEPAFATGFHARNRTILIELVDGSKDSLSTNEEVFKPETPSAEINKYHALNHTLNETKKTLREFEKEWGIRLVYSVQRAIDEAVAEQEATS